MGLFSAEIAFELGSIVSVARTQQVFAAFSFRLAMP